MNQVLTHGVQNFKRSPKTTFAKETNRAFANKKMTTMLLQENNTEVRGERRGGEAAQAVTKKQKLPDGAAKATKVSGVGRF